MKGSSAATGATWQRLLAAEREQAAATATPQVGQWLIKTHRASMRKGAWQSPGVKGTEDGMMQKVKLS